jgi:hypothetical protein
MAFARAMPESTTQWCVNRVFWIREALPHTMRTGDLECVVRRLEPDQLGFRCWSGDVEVDVRSPLSEEAFHAMPFAEQAGLLRTWKPKTLNWDGPVKEGLAATLQAEARARSVYYFEHADQLTGLDPLYSIALVRGFSEGLGGKNVSDWKPFWDFACWVVAQPDPQIEIRDEFSGDAQPGRRWQSCRLEIARFVDAILNGKLSPLPLNERASVWQLIDALRHDPSPAPFDEAREDERVTDSLALSLNTVRGVAAHTVFSYIFWVRSLSPRNATGGQNLDDVPEARCALEAFLDPQFEPSLAIRSVFGANIARLAYWAEAWLRDHLERVLPVQSQDEHSKAAWEAFIRFSVPNSRTLRLLHRHYTAAIARMPRKVMAGNPNRDHGVSLGQHLILDYSQGNLDFEKQGDLLAVFFTRTPESVRAELMAFVGRNLTQSNKTISPEQSARLLKLWNWLVQHESPSGGPGVRDQVA